MKQSACIVALFLSLAEVHIWLEEDLEVIYQNAPKCHHMSNKKCRFGSWLTKTFEDLIPMKILLLFLKWDLTSEDITVIHLKPGNILVIVDGKVWLYCLFAATVYGARRYLRSRRSRGEGGDDLIV